jgi:hypothetical protein
MAAKVFLCYRRDDSAAFAGRVQDRLVQEFGRDLLFMDVDAIPLGVNFVAALHEAVAKCEVLLAVIGPNWLEARDDTGARRLDDPNDYVRIEIGAALQRNIPVIPLLLYGAEVPKPTQLPEDLKELAMRNGLDVRHASFHSDLDKLVRGLKAQLGQDDAEKRRAEEERRRQDEPRRDVEPQLKEQLQPPVKPRMFPWVKPRMLPWVGLYAASLPAAFLYFMISDLNNKLALFFAMIVMLCGGAAGMLVQQLEFDILRAVVIPIIPAGLLIFALGTDLWSLELIVVVSIALIGAAIAVWLAFWWYSKRVRTLAP